MANRPGLDRKGIAISGWVWYWYENELFLNHVYTQTRDVQRFGLRFLKSKTLEKTLALMLSGEVTSNFDNSDNACNDSCIYAISFSDENAMAYNI